MNNGQILETFFLGFGIINLLLALFCIPLSKFLTRLCNRLFSLIEDKIDDMEKKGWDGSKEGFIVAENQIKKTLFIGGILNIVGLIVMKVWFLPLFN